VEGEELVNDVGAQYGAGETTLRNGSAVPLRGWGGWNANAAMMLAPESVPEIGDAGIERMHTRHDRTEVGPIVPMGHELGSFGILENVGGDFRKRVVGAFDVAQDVVVGLSL
jgi:hypothetical protein